MGRALACYDATLSDAYVNICIYPYGFACTCPPLFEWR